MDRSSLPKILCVDDEPQVLEGLKLHLRKRFQVETATGGEAGLEAIGSLGPFDVVVSDMRMPRMSGAAFLARVRQTAPDTVRLLLTGQSDLESAIAAVNEGQIFRFLSKPCPPDSLLAAIEAAVEQYRLITAEHVLLEQTLRGSVKTLTEVLAIAHPALFGRATRARRLVYELLPELGITSGTWEIEIAAMLSPIGCISLPAETVDKLYHGLALTEREHTMVERIPVVTESLLAHIPRLEGVREILRCQDRRYSGVGLPKQEKRGSDLPLGARLLKIVLDFDVLEARGLAPEVVFDTLRGREGWYDPQLLEMFARVKGNAGQSYDVRELKVTALRIGMVLAEDVLNEAGCLLVARGHEITDSVLERMRNFSSAQGVKEPLRVIVKSLAPHPVEVVPAR